MSCSPSLQSRDAKVEYVVLYAVVGLIFGVLGYKVGSQKEAGFEGFLYGCMFGPFGALIACFLDRRANCPHCGTKLNGMPQVCPACRTEFKWNGTKCTYFPPEG